MHLLLISGLPRAGKSQLADLIAASQLGFPHIPLDRYIGAVPAGVTFLDWVKTPNCIDWPLLERQMQGLINGSDCQVPRGFRPNGAPKADPGPTIKAKLRGYVVPGTHAFLMPSGPWTVHKIFVETRDFVLAERMLGRQVSPADGGTALKECLGENASLIAAQKSSADIVVSGELSAAEQMDRMALFGRNCGFL